LRLKEQLYGSFSLQESVSKLTCNKCCEVW